MAVAFLDLSLPTLEANLALDEALLLDAEARAAEGVLRIWESAQTGVVLGSGSRLAEEIDLEQCQRDGVPVCRRASGGGTVMLGPGCLCFSLVVPVARLGGWHPIRSPQKVAGPIADALASCAGPVRVEAAGDLVYQDRKVGGSAQRKLTTHVLHHGTLLYRFDNQLLERYLHMPSRQPDYRQGRAHSDFVGNLPLARQILVHLLQQAWRADRLLESWPRDLTERLLREKYVQDCWIRRR
jgi:lipoate-protein ligase A